MRGYIVRGVAWVVVENGLLCGCLCQGVEFVVHVVRQVFLNVCQLFTQMFKIIIFCIML